MYFVQEYCSKDVNIGWLDAVTIMACTINLPTGGGRVQPPLPKFRRPSKIVPNSTRLWKLLKIPEFRTPTPQDVREKCSKILKLPSVSNCFTLATTNKLVVIIKSLKVPKIKNMLLYEMKFLVPNYSCFQNLWLGGYRSQIPVLSVLCPKLNLLNAPPPEQNSWVRHWLVSWWYKGHFFPGCEKQTVDISTVKKAV